jgi:hypothetical protein
MLSALAADGQVSIAYYPVTDACPPGSVAVATSCGSVTVATSAGMLGSVTASGVPASPTPPEGLEFSCGLIGFQVSGVGAGGSATITVTLPATITPAAYWKLQGGAWAQVTGASISGNVVSFTLTDGGAGDSDGPANGTITDPGGPAVAPPTGVTPVIADLSFLTG